MISQIQRDRRISLLHTSESSKAPLRRFANSGPRKDSLSSPMQPTRPAVIAWRMLRNKPSTSSRPCLIWILLAKLLIGRQTLRDGFAKIVEGTLLDEILFREIDDLQVSRDVDKHLPRAFYINAHAKIRIAMELAFQGCYAGVPIGFA